MSNISESEFTMLTDPKLLAIVDRVKQELCSAGLKAVAHAHAPAQYPLPSDQNALEHRFLAHFKSRKPLTQQLAMARLNVLENAAPMDRARRLGVSAKIDLRSAEPVAAQFERIVPSSSLAVKHDYLLNLKPSAYLGEGHGEPPAGLQPQEQYTHLEVRLRKVYCQYETREAGNTWGQDTILLGGTTVDALGNVAKITTFEVGKFDDNVSKAFQPPRPIATFNLQPGGNVWPKRYYVTLVFAEQDNGGFNDFLNGIAQEARDRLKKYLGNETSKVNNKTFADILNVMIEKVIDAVFGWIRTLIDDDMFEKIQAHAPISSYNHRFANGMTTSGEKYDKTGTQGGLYHVYFDWRVYA